MTCFHSRQWALSSLVLLMWVLHRLPPLIMMFLDAGEGWEVMGSDEFLLVFVLSFHVFPMERLEAVR